MQETSPLEKNPASYRSASPFDEIISQKPGAMHNRITTSASFGSPHNEQPPRTTQ